MPITDASKLASDLSLGSTLAGAVESMIGGVVGLELVAAGTATVLTVSGMGFVLIAVGLGIHAYIETVRTADEGVRQQRLEQGIKLETIRSFSLVSDAITLTQDLLAIVCACDAVREGIDVRVAERDSLRRFIWKRMFPTIEPPTLVATTARVTDAMNAKLNPLLAAQ
jgi:hypothetical protein